MTIQGTSKAPVNVKLGSSNQSIGDPKSSNLRVYQTWKGNNKFCFGGRLIFGPDSRSIFLTVSLILIPVILFCCFVSQRIVHEFQHLGNLILAICIIFTIYIILLLLLTSGRDPGIIPRSLNPPEAREEESDLSSLSSEWPSSYSGSYGVRATKDVVVNGIIVRVKYCHTCKLYRPPRCSHCSVCNNCVERFDHHCPWVGQCIGKRNYRFFFMFVSSTTMLCLFVLVLCCMDIKYIMNVYNCGLLRAFGESPVTVILILYTFIAAWFVGGLTSFHLYLITTNQTTYENFRYRYDRKRNPYNRGCLRNVGGIFFSKIPRSKNSFRDKVVKPADPSSAAFPITPNMSRKIQDIETGIRSNNYSGIFGRLERCDTASTHSNFDPKRKFSGEFDSKNGFSGKKNETDQQARR